MKIEIGDEQILSKENIIDLVIMDNHFPGSPWGVPPMPLTFPMSGHSNWKTRFRHFTVLYFENKFNLKSVYNYQYTSLAMIYVPVL